MPKKTCPKCGSGDIDIASYQGIVCVICKSCGYDETDVYEVFPEQKTSQKAKGSYAPYKAGGRSRTRR